LVGSDELVLLIVNVLTLSISNGTDYKFILDPWHLCQRLAQRVPKVAITAAKCPLRHSRASAFLAYANALVAAQAAGSTACVDLR
jgi:hypothetical protein